MKTRKALKILQNSLAIDSPCSENWDEMRRDGTQRFCEKCQHSIIDFASLTPHDALKIWKQKSRAGERLCGRLTTCNGQKVFTKDTSFPYQVRSQALRGIIALVAYGIGYLQTEVRAEASDDFNVYIADTRQIFDLESAPETVDEQGQSSLSNSQDQYFGEMPESLSPTAGGIGIYSPGIFEDPMYYLVEIPIELGKAFINTLLRYLGF